MILRTTRHSRLRFGTPVFLRQAAFSLMELLVILAIIGILSVGSAFLINSNQSGAVRSLMDELEGIVSNAHQAAVATGKDIALVSWGEWNPNNPTDNPMRIAFGDALLCEGTGSDTNFITIGESILAGTIPSEDSPVLTNTDEFPVTAQQSVSVPFMYSPKSDSVQKRARIVVATDNAWEMATSDKNEDIATIIPFTTEPAWTSALQDGNNFCTGSGEIVSSVYISGSTKRFARTVYIKIIGTDSAGRVIPNGPMGLLVMQGNGASVYKFYNAGANNGEGKWRRL